MKLVPRPTYLDACPGRDVLSAYSLGTLAPDDLEKVAEHLERCDRCLETLQRVDDPSDTLLLELRRPPAGEPVSDDECRRIVEKAAVLYQAPASQADASAAWEAGGSRPPWRVGPYEILEPLGQGGMGAVYKARHSHLGKLVALKLLPRRRMSESAVARFLQEMQAVGRLNHPNIVQAYDAAVEGVPYLAMEFLRGIDLAKLVDRHGPLSVADACECVRQAALALQHAFEHSLVHRDIKPSNLILTPEGVVKLLDLGLARLLGESMSEGGVRLDAGGVRILGTLDYISPEQARDSQAVDIRADLYSLGCTLYFLLTGRTPFGEGTAAEKLLWHQTRLPAAVRALRPAVPEALAEILEARMLTKDPGARFATPADAAAALGPFAAGCDLRGLVGGYSPTADAAAVPGTPPPRRHHPMGVYVACTLLVLLALAGARFLLGGNDWFETAGPAAGELLGPAALEVQQYRATEEGEVLLGRMGERYFAAGVQEDSLRVSARLDEPAYCYLIALRPDGTEELCFPARDSQAPPQTAAITFPAQGGWQLKDGGVGLQAFLLLASRQPLPGYARWKADQGKPPWQPTAAEGVWSYDGRSFERLSRGSPREAPDAEVPSAFETLCRFFQDRSSIAGVSALAFPVQAEAPPLEVLPQP
jgi:tRNA A-37 threonylcarbamoyl transferase component Bud32